MSRRWIASGFERNWNIITPVGTFRSGNAKSSLPQPPLSNLWRPYRSLVSVERTPPTTADPELGTD